jgi:hypothetical protein
LTWHNTNASARFGVSSVLVEALIAAFDEVADELAEAEDEVADAAVLSTVSDRLASRRAKVALAMLGQWAQDAEEGDA